jgi:hypothetical protein
MPVISHRLKTKKAAGSQELQDRDSLRLIRSAACAS